MAGRSLLLLFGLSSAVSAHFKLLSLSVCFSPFANGGLFFLPAISFKANEGSHPSMPCSLVFSLQGGFRGPVVNGHFLRRMRGKFQPPGMVVTSASSFLFLLSLLPQSLKETGESAQSRQEGGFCKPRHAGDVPATPLCPH